MKKTNEAVTIVLEFVVAVLILATLSSLAYQVNILQAKVDVLEERHND